MKTFNHLFVVLEANNDIQPALMRAEQIALLNKARITLCLGANSRMHQIEEDIAVLGDTVSEAQIHQLLTDNCQEFLKKLAEPLQKKAIQIEFSLGWSDDAVDGIIEAVEKSKADLVIKSSRHHSKIKTLFYTPTDWKLLRKCPAPILMVHSEKPHLPQNMLAAVSALAIDEEHSKLDLQVLDYASSISQLFQAKLKVINAFTPVPLGVSLDGTGVYQDEYLQDLQQEHHLKTLELTRKFSISDDQVETRHGDTNSAITECVTELNIDMVIMGTIAREGLAGLFIGNTAEKILESLDCEILTVKI